MSNSTARPFRLESRTFLFAQECRQFVTQTTKTIVSLEDAKQLVRSSGSVAANYIEANEALSKKDFAHRIKICRKESKETILWLKLMSAPEELIDEATQLMKIFGAIIERSK